MSSRKISTITSIVLASVIVLLTGISISILHNSVVFIFLLVLIFLVSTISAFFKTFIEEKKDKILYSNLPSIFGEPISSPKADGNNDLNRNEGPKVHEEDHSKNGQEPFIPLSEYLNRNYYYLKDEIIEAIEWKRFELLCHLIFMASGYNSELTGDGADEGVDIRIFDKNDPRKSLCLVQCKKWQKNKISRELIQQLRGQMATENVEKGGYCVTSTFTSSAKEYAEANNIELFDQRKIIEAFDKLNVYDRELILKELLAGDYWTPSCASCGEKFEAITQKSGKLIWGCKKIKEHGWSQIPYYEAAPIKNVR